MRHTDTNAPHEVGPRRLATAATLVIILLSGAAATHAPAPDGSQTQTLAHDPVGDSAAYGVDNKLASRATNDPGTDLVKVSLQRLDDDSSAVRVRFDDLSSRGTVEQEEMGRQSSRSAAKTTSVTVTTRIVGCQLTLTGQLGGSTGSLRLCDHVDEVVTYTARSLNEFVFIVDHRFLSPTSAAHLERPRSIARGLWARAVTRPFGGTVPVDDALFDDASRADTLPCRGWCIIDEAEDTTVRFRI